MDKRYGHDIDYDPELPQPKAPTRKKRVRTKAMTHSYEKPSARTLMDGIRQLVLDDPTLRPDEIAKEIKLRYGTNVSGVLISRMKTEFKATLRFLQDRGHLKNVTP